MIADFYIPRLSNDMKIVVQKNNLRGHIWYRSSDPVKKRRHIFNILGVVRFRSFGSIYKNRPLDIVRCSTACKTGRVTALNLRGIRSRSAVGNFRVYFESILANLRIDLEIEFGCSQHRYRN